MAKPERDVLIVEDDAAIRRLLALALSRQGLACDEAGDGGPALAKLQAASYAVVLLDFMMPQMNGLDVIKQLDALDQPAEEQPIVLVMTAAPDPDPFIPVAESVHAIIKKPFDVHELAEVVAGCVVARRNHRHAANRTDL